MNVDISFKKYMMKQLNQALENKISKDSIKRLLISILDELEQSSEQFFDIFNSSTTKTKIDMTPFFNYISELTTCLDGSQEKFLYEHHTKQVDFLKKLIANAEHDTSLYRALEDLIIEYESGRFVSRYFKPGEVNNFKTYNFNPYLLLLLENRIKDMKSISQFSIPLLYLIPEYYMNHIKISDLLFDVLKNLFELPPEFTKHKSSILSLHFMTILMAILFEEYDYNKKLKILGDFYEFGIDYSDIEKIAENVSRFSDATYFPDEILKQRENFKLKSELKDMWMVGKIINDLDLPHYNLLINTYIYEKDTNELSKMLALDNIATAKRDLGKINEAINLYEIVVDYYKKTDLYYRKFIVMKNIAFCLYKKGEKERANEIFKELESDISHYSKIELIGVYTNLAYRYRLLAQFEKEEYYINLTLEISNSTDPYYFEHQARSLEIGEYFDFSNGKLDTDALKKLDIKRNHERNKRLAFTHLNNYNLELCEFFLKEAYKEVEIDKDYWMILSNLHILKKEWDKLLISSEMILKQDPKDNFGHLYSCIHYIFKKDNPKIIFHLLKIGSETDYLDPLSFAQLMRALSFICLSQDKGEIKNLVQFAFSKNSENLNIIKLLLNFAIVLVDNRDKELSGFIYKNYMELEKSQESMMLYAKWCSVFNDFKNSELYYKKALSITPNNIELLESISYVNLMLNEFEESIEYIEKIMSLIKPELQEMFIKIKSFIILIRDLKIRYENIPFPDVRIIFNTVEHQLKKLNPNKDIEFGNILTEISKGIENLLAKTIGKLVYEFIKEEHFPIPQEHREGDKKKNIRPINRLFLNFLDDPENNNPTLGNWFYIARGIIEKLNPQNSIMQDIYDFIRDYHSIKTETLKIIYSISNFFIDDRNFATHKKLFTKEEVEKILHTLTPLINELIPFLLNSMKI